MPARQRLESSRTGWPSRGVEVFRYWPPWSTAECPRDAAEPGGPTPAEEAATRPDPGPTQCAHGRKQHAGAKTTLV